MMNHHNSTNETIPCKTCLNDIPDTVHRNAEADEYVANYCGLDCYQLWKEKNHLIPAKNTK